MPVAADEMLCLTDDGTFQNGIVVGIGSDDIQSTRNPDDLGAVSVFHVTAITHRRRGSAVS